MDGAMNDWGVSLDDVVNELQYGVEEAANFMFSEFSEDWELGEAYYAGKCDLPIDEGRSSIVKTESRDAIRALMPNVMRILLQSNKPVEYIPTHVLGGDYADKQGKWVNQQFMANGGYEVLFAAALESMKLKSGPVKVIWEESPHPEHIYTTGLTREQVLMYQDMDDIIVDEVEEVKTPGGGLRYDLRATRYYDNGRLHFEAFPIYEFFCRRDASDLSGLHGHRRSVTVSEALEMGLEHDNWRELDNNDPKENDASAAEQQRRGYSTNQDDALDVDIMNFEFLLTEAYCEYDLDGDGVPEKYVFYLGGSNYTYLHHEQIEDFCIALVSVDPQPFTVIGRSIVDITKQAQDNETSILRAIVDNAHIANNPRPAGDPTKVNFDDLMNNAIGAPIRTRGRAEIQYVETPFTAQGLMPFLQWLEQNAETQVGVTKAARGLDPDAMQSTDKEAVQNTIALSQGQVELAVRNIINTGLIPLFRMALKLSTRHMSNRQVLMHKGVVTPVDTALFDPSLAAIPTIGIGTHSPGEKVSALQFALQKQEQYMVSFGLDNPFTSLSQIYNTLEDIMELGGINNVGRYFNYIDKDAEAIIMQGMMQRQAQQAQEAAQNAPIDPGRAMVLSESFRGRMRNLEVLNDRLMKQMELQQRSIEKAEELDYRRDDMYQDRVIKLLELGLPTEGGANAQITNAQNATSAKPRTVEVPEGQSGRQQSSQRASASGAPGPAGAEGYRTPLRSG